MELRLKIIHFPKKISPLPWKWPKFTKMYKMATENNWNCCILLYFPKSYQISQAIGNQESLALGWNLVHCMLFGSYWIQIDHRNKVPGNIEVKKCHDEESCSRNWQIWWIENYLSFVLTIHSTPPRGEDGPLPGWELRKPTGRTRKLERGVYSKLGGTSQPKDASC